MSSKLKNEDPCSNHGLLDGVGNMINNVYSLKHVKHNKDEFIRYNCSQEVCQGKFLFLLSFLIVSVTHVR